ncbi:uncharacterized protein [Rutidosis leptorrhynchoides]|uniref:uncharacterized protein n=1 Tax=Rutidosis leptorrhynchoides TaxID=125765 RepID=UPI003A9A3E13
MVHLFWLEQMQSASVRDRVRWSENGWEATWNWQLELSCRTQGELDEVKALLDGFQKKDIVTDSWSWGLHNNGVFSTRKLTTLIDEKLLPHNGSREATLKNKLVPSKVEIFIWRVLKHRIPVLTELDKRGIDLDTVRCPLCDDDVETIDHSIFFVDIRWRFRKGFINGGV